MPDKKVLDIFPPKKIEIKPLVKHFVWQKNVLIFILFFLIFSGLFAYFKLPKAEIEIWPETQSLNFKEKITSQTKIFLPDFSKNLIPARNFEIEEEAVQEFLSSGKFLKEEKAEGEIRIFNAYSTSPQVLIRNTRFISAEGKLFRSLEKITIPGGKYEGGKLVPGFIDIKIIAAEAGEDYNISPSTFSIPGLAGTPKYTTIYGKSFSAMEGGFKGEVLKVTKEDLDKAKNILVEKLKTLVEDSLKEKIGSDFILLEGAKKEEILETSSSLEAGAEAKSFNFKGKIKLKVLTFKKSDLENFAREFISSQISDKKIYDQSLKINFLPESIDFEGGKISLDLEFSAKIFKDIQKQELKEILKGKSLAEARSFFSDQSEIKKFEIKIFPFWLKRVPQEIEFKLNID